MRLFFHVFFSRNPRKLQLPSGMSFFLAPNFQMRGQIFASSWRGINLILLGFHKPMPLSTKVSLHDLQGLLTLPILTHEIRIAYMGALWKMSHGSLPDDQRFFCLCATVTGSKRIYPTQRPSEGLRIVGSRHYARRLRDVGCLSANTTRAGSSQ